MGALTIPNGSDGQPLEVWSCLRLRGAFSADWILLKPVELRMLASEDQQGFDSARIERFGDRSKLDGLGTGPDDDDDLAGQPSP